MKFLVDAQLPYLLAIWMRSKGCEVVHTEDLPDKDETEDETIRSISTKASYIVVTEDLDFYDSHLPRNAPEKLLLITTGNIKNRQLLDLFRRNFQEIVNLFEYCDLVEMSNEDMIAHY
ncbi:DUF5615 family PIN-like protein [Persicitalea sp.]|uniref:DUF5615 family PIN-like protein n=1 Tax=Persicitalea sp. TaxID=3100273 RepID=UPI00359432B2